jgi:hypothetical protein
MDMSPIDAENANADGDEARFRISAQPESHPAENG